MAVLKSGIYACIGLLLSTSILSAQWLEWSDETDERLFLSTVANTDPEEKEVEVADLNNDGFDDAIIGRKKPFSNPAGAQLKTDVLLINEGGTLVDRTADYAPGFLSNPTHARDLIIVDFDNDGWKDVVFGNTFGQLPFYYRNLGEDENGEWLGLVDETALRFPLSYDDEPLICAVIQGDIDGDGDMDIYFSNYKLGGDDTNDINDMSKDFLLINNGSGYFTEEAESRLGNLRRSSFGTQVDLKDMDNDGDMDVIKTTQLFIGPPWNDEGTIILYNNGDGTFTNWQNIAQPFDTQTYMFDVKDYNDDGLLDVFLVSDNPDYVLFATEIVADTNIVYTEVSNFSNRLNGFGGNVHSADLDLDGDYDVMIADIDVDIEGFSRKTVLLEYDSENQTFVSPYESLYSTNTLPWADNNTYDFAYIDINGDGLMDILQGKRFGYKLFINDNCDIVPGSADFDLDGISDVCDPCPTNPDPDCTPDPGFPTVDSTRNIARQWNELLLESIRLDLARPTVHARNLFHTSAAMWDIWTTYKKGGCTFLIGSMVGEFECTFDDFTPIDTTDAAVEEAISFAMYRILTHRFGDSGNGTTLKAAYDFKMDQLGYDISYTGTDYSTGLAAAFGNYVGQCYIAFGQQDGSNEQDDYANTVYEPVNNPLVIDNPGNPLISDLNRWQPLTIDLFIDQSGNVIPGATPDFLSPEWGAVTPFALSDSVANTFQRDGFDYKVYHDPGPPPYLEDTASADYKWGFELVSIWSAQLDPSDNVMWDISPNGLGNAADFPTSVSDYSNYYDQLAGGIPTQGYTTNPVTGENYAPNVVPRGDYTRVIAEFWADGPDSETPPGHWFTLLNSNVADHPDFEKKFAGIGPVLDDTEWYVKSYFMLGGAMHDAAVTAWGIKGWYDYLRPISAIRAMADLGQSSDQSLPSYHPKGMTLVEDYIELVTIGDPLAGAGNVNVGKIKIKAWRGHDVINNVDVDEAGVGWILAENWVPYQRPSFVTPPFAGYVSGHSTFSRAAATVLTNLTGSEYFPGGMGTFLAKKEEFLVFEDGPSVDVELQWATYQDAANESALSRIWGGIHPPADDIPGRMMGEKIGLDAFEKALIYFADMDEDGICDSQDNCPTVANPDQAFFEWYIDLDEDGFGQDSLVATCLATPSTGYSSMNTDCDDTNPDINPEALDIPDNGIDEDCDGADNMSSSVDVLSNASIRIYPNPVSDYLQIEIVGQLDFEASLMDVNGRVVQQYINVATLDVRSFVSGMYWLKIRDLDSNKYLMKKIVVGR
jgi:hypothetical protein